VGFRTLVVGFGGTDASWRALAYAVGLARSHGGVCRLVVVSAVRTAERFGLWSELVPLARAANEQEMADRRAALDAVLGDANLGWELRAVVGEPYPIIARIARERHADGIVIGRPAPARWRHPARQPVATRLLRRASCPVIIVP
jgi:nucleotide-binding universal stress UspA family protein